VGGREGVGEKNEKNGLSWAKGRKENIRQKMEKHE
jgi:hypothetical protein